MADKTKRDQVNVRLLHDDRAALERVKKKLVKKAKDHGLDPTISDSVAIRYCLHRTELFGVSD